VRWLLPCLLLALASCFGDAGAEEEEATAAPTPEPVDGAALFQRHCSVCHGPEGRGDGLIAHALDPKPVDLTGPRPEHKRGQPGGRRLVIENGSPGSAMPPWKDALSEAELAAVLRHVHQLRWGEDSEPPAEHRPGQGRGRRHRGGR